MSNALVSAIVTTYKRDVKTVKRALDSIVNQTYENIEVFLVNDCPEDAELSKALSELTESYQCDKKVNYISMPHNGGACAARNLGLKESKGEFVAFLDDDDEWLDTKISEQIKRFDSPNVGLVYCNTYAHYEGKDELVVRESHPMPEGKIYDNLFAENIISSTSFPLIRREAIESVGGFNIAMPSLQDLELWLRMTKKWEVRYVDKPLGTYYFYNGERISRHPERRTKAYETIYSQYKDYLAKKPKVKAAFDRVGVTFYVNTREFDIAGKHLMAAVLGDPLSFKKNAFCVCKYIIRIFIKPKIL